MDFLFSGSRSDYLEEGAFKRHVFSIKEFSTGRDFTLAALLFLIILIILIRLCNNMY